MSQEVFCDCQVNLETTVKLNSTLYRGKYLKCLGSGENLTWGDLAFSQISTLLIFKWYLTDTNPYILETNIIGRIG